MVEERPEHLLPEPERRVGLEPERAEHAAVLDLLAVIPGAQHQEDAVVGGVLGLDRLVDGDGAVDVLLVPQAPDQHRRHRERLAGQNLVHRLVPPERIVARMRQDLAPEADLLEPALPAQLARRSRLHEHVVVVEVAGPPLGFIRAGRLLLVDVGHVLLTEGAVVEPVVPHPAVHHGVHRHRHLEGRVRVDQRHQRQEAVVGDAEDADLAVALGDVLDQPVDGVVRIGRVVHRRRVLRPVERPVHDVVALGAVLAADVLHHADVATFDDHVGGVVVAGEDGAQVRALCVGGELVGAVGGAGEEDGRAVGALWHQDDGVELDPVAHRDHDLAAGVVEAGSRRAEGVGGLARQRRRLRGRARRRGAE